MSGQPGDLINIMALSMVILSGGAFFLTAVSRSKLFTLGVRSYYVQITLAILASAYLFYLFFSHDFSIRYVHNYSSSDLPFFYLVSAFWAGQEGTYLLWFLLSSLFGLVILKWGGIYKVWGMTFYSFINLFLVIMLVIVSPFKPLEFMAQDGAGLNPLLQDFWMVIHPPVMFLAYALSGIPFAFAMAAMAKRDFSDWLKVNFPFVSMVAFLLLAANLLGGYWAYKTLGWGGYWAWDPVENTSFIPWVIAMVLIHGMLIEKRCGALRRWNLLTSTLIFLLVVYGTFLTRSGVLADFSVHSFVDLGANAILVGFMILSLLVAGIVFIYGLGGNMTGKKMDYNIFRIEFLLFSGLFLLFLLGAIVLFWSSLPLITKYVGSTPAAAEKETYNAFAFPLAILICLFITISPLIQLYGRPEGQFKKSALFLTVIPAAGALILYLTNQLSAPVAVVFFIYTGVLLVYLFDRIILPRLLFSIAIGALGVIVALLLSVNNLGYLIFIGAAFASAGSQIIVMVKLLPGNFKTWGGHLSHFGFGIMLVGILTSSAFSTNQRLVIPRDDSGAAFGYDISYKGMEASTMTPNNKVLLTMQKDGSVIEARPEYFYAQRSDGMMKKPYIRNGLVRDLYVIPLEVQQLIDTAGIYLVKGESKQIDKVNLRFIDFGMEPHEDGSDIRVAAIIEAEYGDLKDTIMPILSSGPNGMIGDSVIIPGSGGQMLTLQKVLPDIGSILINFPGGEGDVQIDQLILEISTKPGIAMVWLGAVIICFGTFLSFYHRFYVGKPSNKA
jgi:cytochrome c-type biogenesis protein CcmF